MDFTILHFAIHIVWRANVICTCRKSGIARKTTVAYPELRLVTSNQQNIKNKVIHEIKKSNKVDKAHEWQLKYYMYVFEQHGIDGVKGILEYPLLRKTQEVILTDIDREEIQTIAEEITNVISQEQCPPVTKKGICKNCSYFEFCYINEMEEEE